VLIDEKVIDLHERYSGKLNKSVDSFGYNQKKKKMLGLKGYRINQINAENKCSRTGKF
jgi:hypothetical protein